MAKIDQVVEHVQVLRERLVEKVPGHFGIRHVISAFFGALFFGFSFILNGLLFQVGLALNSKDLWLISIATWLILSAEIYFVGYTRVPNPRNRPFGQFWAKRIVTYYLIALFTSFLLISLYGIPKFAITLGNVFKLLIAVSFPAAVGAAATDLLGKY
jgi:uncharacterized membrane protein